MDLGIPRSAPEKGFEIHGNYFVIRRNGFVNCAQMDVKSVRLDLKTCVSAENEIMISGSSVCTWCQMPL